MQARICDWLDKEFIELSGEGRPGVSVEQQTVELFRRFEQELKGHGLSLQHTARVRVWGRDSEARRLATAARSKILSGENRAASSSFISNSHFDSDAQVALDLLVMKPGDAEAKRRPVDFNPPRNYLRYLSYDSVVFFSGFTAEADSLEKQVTETLTTLDGAMVAAGTAWSRVGRLSIFLQRDHDLETVKSSLAKASRPGFAQIEFSFVDGFAGEKYLIEIEATATK